MSNAIWLIYAAIIINIHAFKYCYIIYLARACTCTAIRLSGKVIGFVCRQHENRHILRSIASHLTIDLMSDA